MPATRTVNGETRQWDGQQWVPQGGAAPDAGSGHGLLPSGLSSLGGLLGLAAPAAAIPGEMIGSAAHELSNSVPKLWEMIQHGGGLFGPMGSEGVGAAMAEPAAHMAEDFAGNAALNAAPGLIGKGLVKAGGALANVGASPNIPGVAARSMVGPLLHYLGMPEGASIAAEVGSIAGPPLAKAAAPLVKGAGEMLPDTALSGLRSVAKAMKPGIEEAPAELESVGPNFRQLSPDAQARNIAATNDVDAGFSRNVAGKLNSIPGAGQSSATRISHLAQIPENSVDNILAGLKRAAVEPGESPITPFTQEKYGVDPAQFGGDRTVGPVEPTMQERLPDSLRQDILGLDQQYQGATYDTRTPYLEPRSQLMQMLDSQMQDARMTQAEDGYEVPNTPGAQALDDLRRAAETQAGMKLRPRSIVP